MALELPPPHSSIEAGGETADRPQYSAGQEKLDALDTLLGRKPYEPCSISVNGRTGPAPGSGRITQDWLKVVAGIKGNPVLSIHWRLSLGGMNLSGYFDDHLALYAVEGLKFSVHPLGSRICEFW